MLDPLRLPSVNSLAGQREGTVGGRVAYRWREVSQLTGSNKTPKSGIQAKCESIGRRAGELHGGRAGGLHGGRVRGLHGGGAGPGVSPGGLRNRPLSRLVFVRAPCGHAFGTEGRAGWVTYSECGPLGGVM
ncbi:hypothetical protein GCM10010385_41020 [Streptomyces geysiriensis]|nr:hypothetical protein GCM10010385_41020 [Streptomyces geysiriensis]